MSSLNPDELNRQIEQLKTKITQSGLPEATQRQLLQSEIFGGVSVDMPPTVCEIMARQLARKRQQFEQKMGRGTSPQPMNLRAPEWPSRRATSDLTVVEPGVDNTEPCPNPRSRGEPSMTTPSLFITPVPEDKRTDQKWRGKIILADGTEVKEPPRYIELTAGQGTLFYGMCTGGWDQWAFAEKGGGGSILLPYAYVTIKEVPCLFVGAVWQTRGNMGPEEHLNAAGDFLDPGETHFQAAQREGSEEAGLTDFGSQFLLKANPGNANRAFFIADPNKDEGLHYYGLKLDEHHLTKSTNGFKIDKSILKPVSKSAEKISGCELVPWKQVARSPDCLLGRGVALLLAHLNLIP